MSWSSASRATTRCLHNSLAFFRTVLAFGPTQSSLDPAISAAAAATLYLTLDTSSAAAREVQDRLDELGNRARLIRR